MISTARENNQAGFSLLELMIVMVLMLVITGMVFSLLRGTIITANANYEMTDASQGLRNSQEFLSRDILAAGDGLKGIASIWAPTSFTVTYLTTQTAAAIDPYGRGFVSLGAIISDNNIPAGTRIPDSSPARNFRPRSDRITMLATDSSFVPRGIPAYSTNYNNGAIRIPGDDLTEFNVGEIYFISDGVSGAFGMITRKDTDNSTIFWENGDSFNLNRIGPSGPMAAATNLSRNPSTLMRMQIIQYYIEEDGKLMRRVFGVKNAAYADSVIAEHVLSIHFRYILKPGSSGGSIFEQPVMHLGEGQAALVRMIEPTITVETANPLAHGEKEQVVGITQLGIRNIQFTEAIVPRDIYGNTELPSPGPTPQVTPTPTPTPVPTRTPTPTPTPVPTPTPSITPTPLPTATVTPTPTPVPTRTPTPTPTRTPTPVPTRTPSPTPTPGNGEG